MALGFVAGFFPVSVIVKTSLWLQVFAIAPPLGLLLVGVPPILGVAAGIWAGRRQWLPKRPWVIVVILVVGWPLVFIPTFPSYVALLREVPIYPDADKGVVEGSSPLGSPSAVIVHLRTKTRAGAIMQFYRYQLLRRGWTPVPNPDEFIPMCVTGYYCSRSFSKARAIVNVRAGSGDANRPGDWWSPAWRGYSWIEIAYFPRMQDRAPAIETRGDILRRTMGDFECHLAVRDQLAPKPFPCDPGYDGSPEGFIGDLADWAEQAGLRRGDRIISMGRVSVATSEERVRALAKIPAGGPLLMEVSRRGQTVMVSLPCRDHSKIWESERRVLAMGAVGDWDGCITASLEEQRVRNKVTFRLLLDRLYCIVAKHNELGKPPDLEWARLLYEVESLNLRWSQYTGHLDNIREDILNAAEQLRHTGFSSMAIDLEDQLRKTQEIKQ